MESYLNVNSSVDWGEYQCQLMNQLQINRSASNPHMQLYGNSVVYGCDTQLTSRAVLSTIGPYAPQVTQQNSPIATTNNTPNPEKILKLQHTYKLVESNPKATNKNTTDKILLLLNFLPIEIHNSLS